MNQEYIVINDFRSLPIAAALNIARRFSKRRIITLVVSRRFLHAHDYGQYFPPIYKKLKLRVIRFFFRLVDVAPNSSSVLTDAEKLGILSSLQSITCDSKASKESYPALFGSFSEAALGAKEIFDYITSGESPARVFIFNGRTASSYPIVKGCYDQKIAVAYYEYATNPFSGYRLYPYPPHSTTRLGADICHFRKISIKSVPDLFLMGKNWGEKKLKNEYTKYYLEATNLTYDVVIFLGSDHEYTCVDEDISGFKFMGNLALIKAVLDKYGKEKTIAVRAHPNQVNDKNYRSTLASIIDLCNEFNVTFYGPESKISSYELIKNSTVVAVEFSSIAYDAVLLGKKVDIFGDLDLKVILSEVRHLQQLDRDYLTTYVREVLSLYDDLFLIKFNRYEAFICRALSILEWNVMRASVAPATLLSIQKT